jgi:hypothetical protein
MTGTAPRSATPNAGDEKAVSENGLRGTENGRVGLFGRAMRPTDASHVDRRQILLGKPPSPAVRSREVSQLGNVS